MKTNRIVIEKDERVEIYVHRHEDEHGVRADLTLIGPVSLNLVVSKREPERISFEELIQVLASDGSLEVVEHTQGRVEMRVTGETRLPE